MEFLTELWLPILMSAVFIFIVSSVIHMVLPIHKNDCTKLPGEDAVLAEMRNQNVTPGEYSFPCPKDMKDMASPEMLEKYNRGPVGFMVVMPNGPFAIGKSLLHWFVYCIFVGIFVAYIANLAMAPGTDYLTVFRITGTCAFLVHAIGGIPNSIWKGQSWKTTGKFMFDGLMYAFATAGAFGWLWPEAV
jgi:hypothetical protein